MGGDIDVADDEFSFIYMDCDGLVFYYGVVREKVVG